MRIKYCLIYTGGGIFYRNIEPIKNIKNINNSLSLELETKSLSQLITASTGMLRYSSGCILETVEVLKADKLNCKPFSEKRTLLGLILKPSLHFNPKIVKSMITSAVKNKVDFIKDDDASEYSVNEVQEIQKLIKNIPYFQKVTSPSALQSEYALMVPWVDGWSLLEETSKRAITMCHCATLSSQISWETHIIFSRLAGASLIIVPDPAFDSSFNVNSALSAATRKISGINLAGLIISGGITPERIHKIIVKIPKEYHEFIGFAAGSWILSHSQDIDDNFILLKKEIPR